jgi:hypothetical protein
VLTPSSCNTSAHQTGAYMQLKARCRCRCRCSCVLCNRETAIGGAASRYSNVVPATSR